MAGPLPPDLAMLLPKGFVENTTEIYAEVASYPVIPPEKIWAYWHVYTTTFRKLIDPTAHRLENFWWHVWGSDRRFLSGKALAKIYEDISTGPTFMPLKGPPNRYEGPSTPRSNRPAPQKQGTQQHQQSSQVEIEDDEDGSPTPPKKERTSSSAKPPPTHSILKKPRGPSASGPRPTARFVSPHNSDDEGDKNGEEGSSSSGAATAPAPIENRGSPAANPEKKATPPTMKKFVASSSTSKRRPVLARRQSSQSSTGSEAGSRETVSSSGSRYSGSRTVPPIPEHAPRPTASNSQDSSKPPTQLEHPALSDKAAGKRPAVGPVDRSLVPQSAERHDRPVILQAEVAVPQIRSLEDVRRNMEPYQPPRPRTGATRPILQLGEPARFPVENQGAGWSQSPAVAEQPVPRERSVGRPPPLGLLSASVAATSNVAAQGTFDSENPDVQAVPSFSVPGESTLLGPSSRSYAPSLSSTVLKPRFTPTPRSNTPAVPFGRTKSQLTLLLEREKERTGGTKPRSSREREEDS